MIGEGLVFLDIALFMLTCGAAAVHVYFLPSWYSHSPGLGLIRLLRLVGWLILGARFGAVLFTTGDILISLPSIIGLSFLAAGDICAIFNRGKTIQL